MTHEEIIALCKALRAEGLTEVAVGDFKAVFGPPPEKNPGLPPVPVEKVRATGPLTEEQALEALEKSFEDYMP